MAQTNQHKCQHCGKTFTSERELNEHEKQCKQSSELALIRAKSVEQSKVLDVSNATARRSSSVFQQTTL